MNIWIAAAVLVYVGATAGACNSDFASVAALTESAWPVGFQPAAVVESRGEPGGRFLLAGNLVHTVPTSADLRAFARRTVVPTRRTVQPRLAPASIQNSDDTPDAGDDDDTPDREAAVDALQFESVLHRLERMRWIEALQPDTFVPQKIGPPP